MYKKIKLTELFKIKDPIIIDVREPDEYRRGCISKATNIPAGTLVDNCEKYLSIHKKYYIYCETSLRSMRVCEFLSDLGYDVYLIEGGYKEWLAIKEILK
ncbi:MAG: rhodanese-like domain-containing protein [Bacilli bacterium]|nr:rhodanese-like domain-containing protein [Bacilli bacterium]MDD3305404.1 rhodanese-like domain-containing protein [Bacilli bacterium]MDD4053342.1 rhodanese-like domain-containing protein [Bacilli bacterium]MDD4411011.1 rhodanese-like domain-containing protein [Bacilli bacterium]